MITDILLAELKQINEINKQLLTTLKETPSFLADPDTEKLRTHFKKQQELSEIQTKQIIEIGDIVHSTHYKNLSELASNSNSQELTNAVIELKSTMYEILLINNQNKILIEDCSRITNTQLNLMIGKKQEPTNYNFSSKNINAHLFNKLKSNT